MTLDNLNPNLHAPILKNKYCDRPSIFEPENLLREARRQNKLKPGKVPKICILDPDGDIVRNLKAKGKAKLNPFWACYHSDMYSFEYENIEYGIIGCAVGASYAVLLAEQLFVSGCEFLISITSSGQITSIANPPFFVLIDKSLRDEGTSYHYLPKSKYSYINKELLDNLKDISSNINIPVYQGATWTTDAPYRETQEAIDYAQSENILAVEMEAAALYAFATARNKNVVCFAHVTNQMANIEGDFEKGENQGSKDALKLIAAVTSLQYDL